jgi:hypothetical protein
MLWLLDALFLIGALVILISIIVMALLKEKNK